MESTNKRRKYEGQALAITMVVLVVSALIGLSIYSRSMKDKMLILEERASAEALEVTDVALEKITSLPIEEVITQLRETFADFGTRIDGGIEFTENREKSEITELFRDLELITDTESIDFLLSPLCPTDTGGNEYRLTIKTADEGTFYEVRAGHVWSLPARDLLKSKNNCTLNMNFGIRGDSKAGFVVSKIYCNYDEEGNIVNCDKYSVADDRNFSKYCFATGQDSSNCNNENFEDSDNWHKFDPDNENFSDIFMMSEDDSPSEIRVTAVGGTIGINYSLPEEDCIEGLRMYQLKATANCSGVYRGKEILIPEEEWFETIFDYVIFSDKDSI
jgi:hypothetical protein